MRGRDPLPLLLTYYALGQMATEPPTSGLQPETTPQRTERWLRYRRTLAFATSVVFFISSAFPLVAGISKNTASFPKLWGALDVGIAFVLAFLAILLVTLAQGHVSKQAEDASYHFYRILNHGILALRMVFMLNGDRIIWVNCITGFAWRTWFLVYCLPMWIAARSNPPSFRERESVMIG